jgi:hypothetical protein
MVVLVGAGCSSTPRVVDPLALPELIRVDASPSPFSQVTAGPVHAWIPDGWDTQAAGSDYDPRGGFVSSPQLDAWKRMDGSTTGMTATWVDATEVGVPSDFYYLAARGPLMSQLTHSARCSPERERVFLDHRPSFASGDATSTGDFMARGEGTCDLHGVPTRWAYFVAAPGFGPVRELGIPSSGLYVVVAVMHDGARAASALSRLIRHTSFAGTSVPELVDAARGRPAV